MPESRSHEAAVNRIAADGVLVRLATETMNIAAPLEHPSNCVARQELLGWQRRAATLGVWSYESDFAPHSGFGGYGITGDLPSSNVPAARFISGAGSSVLASAGLNGLRKPKP